MIRPDGSVEVIVEDPTTGSQLLFQFERVDASQHENIRLAACLILLYDLSSMTSFRNITERLYPSIKDILNL